MVHFSHIINPVKVKKSSDLFIAQPITFETMRVAREFCSTFCEKQIQVNHLIARYPEDHEVIPSGFKVTADLDRSVLDIGIFNFPRKLPLLKDILDRLYNNSEAEYLIYCNVDIALQPYFYWTVSKIIQQGYDAFIINRRTVTTAFHQVAEIPLMYATVGEKHPGWDCFIFKRTLYPKFELGNACIGAGWIGRVMISNMACLAERFNIFTDLHITFHIGNERIWKNGLFDDYLEHNKSECKKILMKFEEKYGPFDREKLPGRFMRKFF